MAEEFVATTGIEIPVVVDSMENTFMERFAAWPERFYVMQWTGTTIGYALEGVGERVEGPQSGISQWRVRFVNEPDFMADIGGVGGHKIDHLRAWLAEHFPVDEALTRTRSAQAIKLAAVDEKAEAIFKAADVSGDGKLDMGEVMGLVARMGWYDRVVKATFSMVDTNKDGSVSLEEFKAFYSSFDEKARNKLREMAMLPHVGEMKTGGAHGEVHSNSMGVPIAGGVFEEA